MWIKYLHKLCTVINASKYKSNKYSMRNFNEVNDFLIAEIGVFVIINF